MKEGSWVIVSLADVPQLIIVGKDTFEGNVFGGSGRNQVGLSS
jgi:hypothetical protein